jgi:hypothetical protein
MAFSGDTGGTMMIPYIPLRTIRDVQYQAPGGAGSTAPGWGDLTAGIARLGASRPLDVRVRSLARFFQVIAGNVSMRMPSQT